MHFQISNRAAFQRAFSNLKNGPHVRALNEQQGSARSSDFSESRMGSKSCARVEPEAGNQNRLKVVGEKLRAMMPWLGWSLSVTARGVGALVR